MKLHQSPIWVLLLAILSQIAPPALATEELRVTWTFTKSAETPDSAWALFQSYMATDATKIFDEVSAAREPGDLPLSFPGESSPWDSSVEKADFSFDPGVLTVQYDVFVNDVTLTNLTSAERAAWLCQLVTDWRAPIAVWAAERWSSPGVFEATVTQTACQTHDDVLEQVSTAFRFAQPLGGLWYNSAWFGDFSAEFYPWIYQEQVGWVYLAPQENPADGIYFWHGEDQIWYWTGEGVFPEAFDLNLKRWVIFR